MSFFLLVFHLSKSALKSSSAFARLLASVSTSAVNCGGEREARLQRPYFVNIGSPPSI